jgi:hypothetical protein
MAHKKFASLKAAQNFVRKQKKAGHDVAGILDKKVGKKWIWEVSYYSK